MKNPIFETYLIPVDNDKIQNQEKAMCNNCRYVYIFYNWMQYCPRCGCKIKTENRKDVK